jgi:large repetitive protein
MPIKTLFLLPALLGVAWANPAGYVATSCPLAPAPCPLPSSVAVLNLASNTQSAMLRLGAQATEAAVSPDGARVYVTGRLAVYVVQTANHQTAIIPLGVNATHIAIRPDGQYAYVSATNRSGQSPQVLVIQTSTNQVMAMAPLAAAANAIAASPDNQHVYLALSNGSLAVLTTSTNQVATFPTPSPLLEGVAVTPDNAGLYVSGYLDAQNTGVMLLSAATHAVLATIPVGGQVYGIALTPSGAQAYVLTSAPAGSGSGGSAAVLQTSTNTLLASIGVGPSPTHLAVTPDGAGVYVANADSTVSVISTAAQAVTSTVPVYAPNAQIAITPDSQHAYLVAPTGVASEFDISTGNPIAHIPVGAAPGGMAATGAGTLVYVSNAASNSISVIDSVPGKVLKTLTVPANPRAIALNKSASQIYVAVVPPNGGAGSVVVLNTSTGAVVRQVTVPSSTGNYGVPVAFALTPDGSKMYVSVAEIPLPGAPQTSAAGYVMVFKTPTLGLGAIITGPGGGGMAITPDGKSVYVGSAAGTAVISTATNKVLTNIPLVLSVSIAINAAGTTGYMADNSGNLWVVSLPQNQVVTHLPVPGFPLSTVALTPDGSQAWITGSSANVSILSTATNTITGSLAAGGPTGGIVFTQ